LPHSPKGPLLAADKLLMYPRFEATTSAKISALLRLCTCNALAIAAARLSKSSASLSSR
jgi:hypothetical protein